IHEREREREREREQEPCQAGALFITAGPERLFTMGYRSMGKGGLSRGLSAAGRRAFTGAIYTKYVYKYWGGDIYAIHIYAGFGVIRRIAYI
ncbi:MAG: hypothetical protein LBQ14_05905, partial [Treponema sp.]|nr:hypothetical protein [Treponema sp.]